MEYTAVIRTLGMAGSKYQHLLDSLNIQSIKPNRIIVYIAKGYPIPQETIGKEEYVYVDKGMAAQRALGYDDVLTEYILFLDDDLLLPFNFVENCYKHLKENDADVISPDIFQNNKRRFTSVIPFIVSGRMLPRYIDDKWGYKVLRSTGFSYRKCIDQDCYPSQTNAGACLFCKKDYFLKAHFEDELWVDISPYALGEDQILFYKMYKQGRKILTWYNSGIKHLDGGDNLNPEKEKRLIFSDFRFKTIFWHRFIFSTENSFFFKFIDCICIGYTFIFSMIASLIKCRFDILKIKCLAIDNGLSFIKSDEYKKLPKIKYYNE